MAEFVVKLQVPLVFSGVEPEALIYDETKQFCEQLPINEDVTKLMHGRYKAFFRITILDNTVHFLEEVPDPGW